MTIIASLIGFLLLLAVGPLGDVVGGLPVSASTAADDQTDVAAALAVRTLSREQAELAVAFVRSDEHVKSILSMGGWRFGEVGAWFTSDPPELLGAVVQLLRDDPIDIAAVVPMTSADPQGSKPFVSFDARLRAGQVTELTIEVDLQNGRVAGVFTMDGSYNSVDLPADVSIPPDTDLPD